MTFTSGQNTDIDAAAEQIDPTDRGLVVKVMIIQADDDNTDSIYVGPAGVTTSTGYRLAAGKALRLALNDADYSSVKNTEVYAIGGAANQAAGYIYQ